MQAEGVSERRACGLAGQQRSTQRYAPRPRGDDEPVKESLHRLASRWPRFGLPRLAYLVREELGPVNRKRICRLYREAGLQLPRKRKGRRRGSGRTGLAERPVRPLHRWSMDFVSDTFADGRRLRVLAVIDNFTRACLALEVDTSLGAERVVRVLRRLPRRNSFYNVSLGVQHPPGGHRATEASTNFMCERSRAILSL